MSLTPTFIGDNPQQPGIQAQVYVPDQLIVDARNLVTQPILIGAGNLKRGTVLGQQNTSPVVATATPGNTGNATIGSVSAGSAPLTGVYKATATSATSFAVTDPEGAAVGTATAGSAFTSTGVNFTITAGATPMVAGDSFTITVADAVGTYIACVRTASDGSQNPVAILADDADATAGPVTSGGYLFGEFNAQRVIFDSSWNLAQLVSAARAFGLFLKSTVSANSPANNTAP
ncbi:head decoration protein [Luteibacter aegosomaticola]|uniref:head decoration protein n=1 Tax=Luteibacter aegosomaticola TaxID=2911538 RepID=UPI001FFBD7E2|nr:head decoration protein [Luteibacter aegosomaticola]UPG89275.1 head decoration protein [Luteibacter aegosomaticola]